MANEPARVAMRPAVVCVCTGGFLALGLLDHFGDYPSWADYLPLALSFGLGVAIGRWWALLIAAGLSLISIPLHGVGEALPAGTAFVALTAVGVGVRLAASQTSRDYRAVRRQTLGVVLAYVAAMGGLVVYAASLETGDDARAGTVAFLAAQVLVGLALGRWRALFLVAILPVLAIPVPTPQDAYEPLPLWFGMLIFAPFTAGLIGMGVAARRVWEWWRSPAAA